MAQSTFFFCHGCAGGEGGLGTDVALRLLWDAGGGVSRAHGGGGASSEDENLHHGWVWILLQGKPKAQPHVSGGTRCRRGVPFARCRRPHAARMHACMCGAAGAAPSRGTRVAAPPAHKTTANPRNLLRAERAHQRRAPRKPSTLCPAPARGSPRAGRSKAVPRGGARARKRHAPRSFCGCAPPRTFSPVEPSRLRILVPSQPCKSAKEGTWSLQIDGEEARRRGVSRILWVGSVRMDLAQLQLKSWYVPPRRRMPDSVCPDAFEGLCALRVCRGPCRHSARWHRCKKNLHCMPFAIEENVPARVPHPRTHRPRLRAPRPTRACPTHAPPRARVGQARRRAGR